MSESAYKVVEVIGTSTESWERAAAMAMMNAAKTLRDIRIGEVVSTDLHLDGETLVYRTRIKLSFKYHDE